MKRLDQFLLLRKGTWHYTRRVPDRYAHLDKRGRIRCSLRTDSLSLARRKRDDMVEADNAYWASLLTDTPQNLKNPDIAIQSPSVNRYNAAKKRAMARGYVYAPTAELVENTGLNEIVARLADALKKAEPVTQQQEVEARPSCADEQASPSHI